MSLHPDLAELDARYLELHERVLRGELSMPDAVGELRRLVAVDAQGSQWGLDENGNFYRIRSGDAVAEVCDPSLFAAPLPRRQGRAPWEEPEVLMGPPAELAGGLVPEPVRRGRRSGARTGAHADARGLVAPEPGPVPAGSPGPPAPLRRRRTARWTSYVSALTTGRGRTIVLVALGALCLAYLALFVRDDAPDVGPGAVSTTSAPAVPSTERPAEPGSLPAQQGPSPERVAEAVAGVTGGDVSVASAFVERPGSRSAAVLSVAGLDGLDSSGLSVRTGEVRASSPGRGLQTWTLVGADGTTWASATVSWELGGDGVWRLGTWPAFKAG